MLTGDSMTRPDPLPTVPCPSRAPARAGGPLGPRATAVLAPLLALLLTLFAGFGAAQVVPEGAVRSGPLALEGDDPEALADRAVEVWLEQEPADLATLSRTDVEALCEALPALFVAPPPPEGTTVELDDRRERPTEEEDTRRFTYAAEVPPERLMVVEVVVRSVPETDGWIVERTGFQTEAPRGRPWLQSREAGLGFLLFTVLVAAAAWRSRPFRRWLGAGVASIRAHRRLVAFTMIIGWALVFAGLSTGAQLPDACETAVLAILGDTLESVGAVQALQSGDVARTAAVIFYQNFVVVTLGALFGSALLLGLPAYLLAGVSFFAQTVAFGTIGLGGGAAFVITAILFVIEFTAYFLAVSGGGMVLVGLIRGGLEGLGQGYRRLFSLIPIVALILLVGAWYEAIVLLL